MESNYTTRILNYAIQTCGFYPLRPMQLYLFDMQLTKARSTMLNCSFLFKLDNRIDTERLAKAVTETLQNHDIFSCRYFFHPGTSDLCQRFDGEIAPIKVEKMSDEEFEIRKTKLAEPYKLIENPLVRVHVFETPTTKYCYIDGHHSIVDGIDFFVHFTREVDLRYRNKPPKHIAAKYSELIEKEILISPEEIAAGNNYWREMLKNFDEKKHLLPADVENDSPREEIAQIIFKNIKKNYFEKKSTNENNFFLAAVMLAIAKSTGSKSSVMNWLSSGRTNIHESRIVGIMIEQFPIAWDFDENMTVAEFLEGLNEKINFGMKYRRSLEMVYSEGLLDGTATFIFQKGDISRHNKSFKIDGMFAEELDLPDEYHDDVPNENALDFEFHEEKSGNYSLELAYSTSKHSEESMQKFVESIDEIILYLQDENIKLGEIL